MQRAMMKMKSHVCPTAIKSQEKKQQWTNKIITVLTWCEQTANWTKTSELSLK